MKLAFLNHSQLSPHHKHQLKTRAIGLALGLITTLTVPHIWCGRGAEDWYRGDKQTQIRLARSVEAWANKDLQQDQFHTGSSEFNGEWLLMTYQFAGLGFGQTARKHPELRAQYAYMMQRCSARLLEPDARMFDSAAWTEDALKSLKGSHGHAGFLGYTNTLLSYERWLNSEGGTSDKTARTRVASDDAVNDSITEALLRRLSASSTGLIETYPGEMYPVDNCVGVASIALHGRATGRDYSAFISKWCANLRKRYVDPKSGMLYQSVDPETGAPVGAPRASGTLFSAYFLSFVDAQLSKDLFAAVQRNQVTHVAGFGAICEYPAGYIGELGDIDSGPVVFGLSTSGTAFALAGARIHGDEALFRDIYSTLYLVGTPIDRGDRENFLIGGPLGDALLFALMTAQPEAEVMQ